MDRAVPSAVQRRRKVKRYAAVGVAVVALMVVVWGIRALLAPTLKQSRIRTATAEIGMVAASVTASGVIVPESEQSITAPVASTIASLNHYPGDSVAAGESILRLDLEDLETALQKEQDELDIRKNKKDQLALDLERKSIDLQASYDVKVLQTQFVELQSQRTAHLFKIGGATEIDRDRAALDVEIAKRELEQLSGQITNQKASLEADLRELELQIRIQENRVAEIRRDIARAEARTEFPGVVTWINENIGASVNQGDVIARVADLGSFRVEAQISDVHAAKLQSGGPVTVRIGKHELDGQITAVRPSVQNGVMTFMVALADKSHPALRPNLRADVFVVTAFRDDVIRVKNGPFYDGSVDQIIFVLDGDRAVARTVTVGASNFDWVELSGDIAPGDVVIVSDTKPYRHMNEIAIVGD